MSHCPSHDWDSYYDSMERGAMEAAQNELAALAEKILPALLANPRQFPPKMAEEDVVCQAFQVAAQFLSVKNKLMNGGTRFISVPYRADLKEEEDCWEDKFWRQWGEELLP